MLRNTKNNIVYKSIKEDIEYKTGDKIALINEVTNKVVDVVVISNGNLESSDTNYSLISLLSGRAYIKDCNYLTLKDYISDHLGVVKLVKEITFNLEM